MIRVLLLCAGIFQTQLLTGCDNKPAASSRPGLPAVTVSRPVQQKITEWDEYTGRFVAVRKPLRDTRSCLRFHQLHSFQGWPDR